MDFGVSEEQHELQRSARSMLEVECPRSLVREVVEKGSVPERLWRQMTELGWPALAISEEDGGIGLGFVELSLVVEELGRAVAPGPFFATTTQFAPAIEEGGSSTQRGRWLTPVAEGRIAGTFAVAEQSGIWDADTIRARAERHGDTWRLHGTKHYVIDASRSNEMVVAAGDDLGEVALFVVPTSDVTVTPIRSVDASREVATVTLAGVEVGTDRRLDGAPGARALTRAVEVGTVAIATETVGTCQAILDLTLEHVRVREQFDAPLGSFQAVKHLCADMYVALERARSTCRFAAMTIAEDDPRRALGAAMAKAAAGDAEQTISRGGIQLHGGIGYSWEHDVHLLAKRAIASAALLGSARTHRRRISDHLASA